jgi:hypothetical protein
MKLRSTTPKVLSEYAVEIQKEINQLQELYWEWILGTGFPGMNDAERQRVFDRICRLHEQLVAVRRLAGSVGVKVPWLIKDESFARSLIGGAWLSPDALRRRPIARNLSAN